MPPLHVRPLVRVRPEEISLRLDEVRRKSSAAVRVKVRERAGHRGRRDPGVDRRGHDAPPRLVALHELGRELAVDEQRREVRVLVVRLLDAVEEPRADDAPALPDPSHFAEVEPPLLLRGLRADEVHALRVRANLRGVQRRADVVHELFLLLRGELRRRGVRGGEAGGLVARLRGDSLVLHAGDEARVERRCDRRDRDGELRGLLHRPLPGAFHPGLVQNLIHERAAVGDLVVLLRENQRGDLDEERVQLRGVPLVERGRELRVREPADGLQDVVRLGDELHVPVLDAVVHHLNEVPGAAFADERDARAGVRLRGGRREHFLHGLVRLHVAAGHHGRTVPRALFAAGDAHAHVEEVLRVRLLDAAFGVLVPLVPAVDDDVPGLHVLGEAFDRRVHGRARFHEDDHGARLLKRVHEFLHVLVPDELVAEAFFLRARDRVVGLIAGAVEHGDLEPLLRDVQREVLSHHGEADEADAALFFVRHGVDADAGSASDGLAGLVRRGPEDARGGERGRCTERGRG
mmetsp:Transcript_932/g.3085  ORF Transcript_932/g.3085 Transcript_932/m.3085 type:complete len:519 (+) Transcript_932:241-1797(+)